jgi:hypothetical protein
MSLMGFSALAACPKVLPLDTIRRKSQGSHTTLALVEEKLLPEAEFGGAGKIGS